MIGEGFRIGGKGEEECDGTVGVWLSLLLAFREGGARPETPTTPCEVELPLFPEEVDLTPTTFSFTGDSMDSSTTGPTSICVRCLLFDRGSLTSVFKDNNPLPLKPEVVVVELTPPPPWNMPDEDEVVEGEGIAEVETALWRDREVGD